MCDETISFMEFEVKNIKEILDKHFEAEAKDILVLYLVYIYANGKV